MSAERIEICKQMYISKESALIKKNKDRTALEITFYIILIKEYEQIQVLSHFRTSGMFVCLIIRYRNELHHVHSFYYK